MQEKSIRVKFEHYIIYMTLAPLAIYLASSLFRNNLNLETMLYLLVPTPIIGGLAYYFVNEGRLTELKLEKLIPVVFLTVLVTFIIDLILLSLFS